MSETCIYINGLCRCCHARGNFKSLGVPYVLGESEEIYAVMVRKTFDILITPQSGESSASTYTICESCIVSLQDAARFKLQVLSCEEKFSKFLFDFDVKMEVVNPGDEVKNERCCQKKDGSFDHKCKVEEGSLPAAVNTLEPKLDDATSCLSSVKMTDNSLSSDERDGMITPDLVHKDLSTKRKNNFKKRIKKFACKDCHKKFKKRTNLDNHMRTHIETKSYTCHICQIKFAKIKELTKHVKVTHCYGETFPCDKCNDVFDTAVSLIQHLNKHFNNVFICNECGKQFKNKPGLIEHIKIHTGSERINCKICDKSFAKKSYLYFHMRTHSAFKPYVCDVCGRCFTFRSRLKRHNLLIHSGEKPYECGVCQKQFPMKQYLDLHMKQHTGEALFACETCQKTFSTVANLKTHLRVHTGEKPYSCSTCGWQFTQKFNLKMHEKTHTGEKPFKCEICNHSFRQKGNLKAHMRTHTGEKPYRCEMCDQQFCEKRSLQKHVRAHNGEKFTCKICDKEIINLQRHIRRMHSGGMSFDCRICNKQFASSKGLRVHMEGHPQTLST